jgi:predicted restriction endonuclease
VFPKTINNDESMGISSKEVTGGNELNIIGNTISGQSGDLSLPILDTEQSELSISSNAQDDLSTDTENLTTDEREAVVKVRFGQGSFRDVLIGILGAKCWMSGVEGKQLLVASHIKPWSHCKEDADSRGNSNNGLLLSSLWDSAFDAGLISFDEDWQVICSTVLSQSAKQALNLDQYKVLPEKIRNVGRAKFLAYHRAEVFEGWKKETSPKEGNK